MNDVYRICGIVIELDLQNDRYFIGQIDKYRIPYQTPEHRITVSIEEELSLPNWESITQYKNRQLLKNGKMNAMISSDSQSGKLTHLFIYDDDYLNVQLLFAKSLGERLPELEYLFTGIFFYEICLRKGYVTLHASAIQYQNEAFLISAPSGTGKSTLANWWLSAFPGSIIINDDKPTLLQKDQQFYVSGSPWSGKSQVNENQEVPLKAIFFLRQGTSDSIQTLDNASKITHVMRNIYRPREVEAIDLTITQIEHMIEKIDICEYTCQNHLEAAIILHDYLYKEDSK